MEIINGDGGTRVEARLVDHPKIIGRKLIQIRVASSMKPGLKSSQVVDPQSEENVHLRVMAHAENLAEYQNETFGDSHDPRGCALAAKRAFYELMQKLREKAMI